FPLPFFKIIELIEENILYFGTSLSRSLSGKTTPLSRQDSFSTSITNEMREETIKAAYETFKEITA
ncbi:hypothetical protein, partial [Sulfurovum sp.]